MQHAIQLIKKSLKDIIVICGATSSGKSGLAMQLAKIIGAEIVSCDSVAVYCGLDIGSAKPNMQDLLDIPHHLIDIIEPNQTFSVYEFVQLANLAIQDIISRNKKVIIVGGTGLYLKAVLYKNSIDKNTHNPLVALELNQQLLAYGKDYMYNQLVEIDPITASTLSVNDTRRVLRAIGIYKTSGVVKSTLIKHDGEKLFDFDIFGLNIPREVLYDRINKRVDGMIDRGLIREVQQLMPYKDCQSMSSIGYKQVVEYLDNGGNLYDTIELIKKVTRNYAKRQLTFFRAMQDIQWIECS